MRCEDTTGQTELDDLGETSCTPLLRCPARLSGRQAEPQGPQNAVQLRSRIAVTLRGGEVLASEGEAIACRSLDLEQQAFLSASGMLS